MELPKKWLADIGIRGGAATYDRVTLPMALQLSLGR